MDKSIFTVILEFVNIFKDEKSDAVMQTTFIGLRRGNVSHVDDYHLLEDDTVWLL
jgi:hypothetical protein